MNVKLTYCKNNPLTNWVIYTCTLTGPSFAEHFSFIAFPLWTCKWNSPSSGAK